MAGFRIEGNTSGNVAEVDSSNQIKVVLPTAINNASYVKLTDSNSHTASVTSEGRLSVGMDSLQFQETVDGAVVNTRNWVQSNLTMTQVVSGAFIVENSGAITTANTYSILTSTKQFALTTAFANRFTWILKTPNIPQANATMEVGVGFVSGTSAPTGAGAYFRWKSDGTFIAAANWSGTEVSSSSLSIPSINTIHVFEISINHANMEFYIDDALVATIGASGNAIPTVPTHIPLFARVYTGGSAPSTAPQLFISYASAEQVDANNNKLWTHQIAGMWRGITTSPVTSFLSTANHANSTNPASATLSNTTAGYTTLGGRFQFATVAGAATDYCLFAYQVPTGYQAYITGIRISVINTGAAVAVTPTVIDWSLGMNSSAVSLATADSPPTSWGPIRTPLGLQSFIVASGIGATVPEIYIQFETPLVCDSGRYIHVIMQLPIGTATVSQIIRGDIMFNGYFE